jgi:hypothetical protein
MTDHIQFADDFRPTTARKQRKQSKQSKQAAMADKKPKDAQRRTALFKEEKQKVAVARAAQEKTRTKALRGKRSGASKIEAGLAPRSMKDTDVYYGKEDDDDYEQNCSCGDYLEEEDD